MLTEVCLAISTRLRLIPGLESAPDEPSPQLPDDRMLIVYPNTGTGTPLTHGGKGGSPVIQYRDTFVVEVHRKLAEDQMAAGVQWATPMLDAVRDTIWSEYARNRFGGAVMGLHSVNTDTFGELGWGSDPTFGFRLTLDISHASEVSAGRAD